MKAARSAPGADNASPCWQAKPCPFCGWVPNVQPWHGGKPTKVLISCDYSRCAPSPAVTGETRTQALRRWNRRAS